MKKRDEIRASIEPLKLFNQKAQRLGTLSFIRKHARNRLSITIQNVRNGNGDVHVQQTRVDDESLDAVVLTLRFFIQDNESCSFKNLSHLYANWDALKPFATEFEVHRTALNSLLSFEPDPQPPKGQFGRPMTLRDILDVFLYGALAHSNDDRKRSIYDAWMNEPISEAAYSHLFQNLVMSLLGTISQVAQLNVRAINALRT